MTRRFHSEKAVPRPAKLLLGLALSLCAPFAIGQNNVGELLDAGAERLSPEQFKGEVVQRVIVGPTATGGQIEVMYAANGMVQGRGSSTGIMGAGGVLMSPINGEWTIGDNGRICTSMRIMGTAYTNVVILPPRCQFWFKYKEQYFFSDSDTDRSMGVLRRTVKQ
jgi:hypothetical protein